MNAVSRLVVTAIIATMVAPVQAVNKCMDANGRVVYQDRPCPGAKQVDARPNSVDGSLDPEVAKRLAEAEAKIKARLAQEDKDRAARSQRISAYWRECDGYSDEIERQSAWLHSISPAVRASAAANIDIARKKYVGAGCGAPSAVN